MSDILQQIQSKKNRFIYDTGLRPNRLILGDLEHRALTEWAKHQFLVRGANLIGKPEMFEAMTVLRVLQTNWLEVAFA